MKTAFIYFLYSDTYLDYDEGPTHFLKIIRLQLTVGKSMRFYFAILKVLRETLFRLSSKLKDPAYNFVIH
jgi:hypothetical protein